MVAMISVIKMACVHAARNFRSLLIERQVERKSFAYRVKREKDIPFSSLFKTVFENRKRTPIR